MRGSAILVLALALAACGDDTAPPVDGFDAELRVVGLRIGHDIAATALVASTLDGTAQLRSDGTADLVLERNELRLAGLAGTPSIAAQLLADTTTLTYELDAAGEMHGSDPTLLAGAVARDRERLVAVSRNPDNAGEAGIVIAGRPGSAQAGTFHVRGFALEVHAAGELVGATLVGSLELDTSGAYTLSKLTAHEQRWSLPFATAGLTVATITLPDEIGDYQVDATGAFTLVPAGGALWRGFQASSGSEIYLAQSSSSARALLVATRAATVLDGSAVDVTHHVAGFSLELEGRPYIASVITYGTMRIEPAQATFELDHDKLRWLDPPTGQASPEVLVLRPRDPHTILTDGTFGRTGEPLPHVLDPDLAASTFVLDFDVFDPDRVESTRGLLIGLD